MRARSVIAGAAGMALLGMSVLWPVYAQDAGPETSYSGDLLTRSTLSGDWGGARNELAAKGIKFDVSVTQITQGVVDGGKNGGWEYGGRGILAAHLDTQKLGLWPGGFLATELEGNWSSGVNTKTGALTPVNTNQLFPVPGGEHVGLSQLVYAQFVSHYAGALVGKLDTMTGDANEFAHGKGDTQFLNLAFNINPALLTVPYSTLGSGLILLPTADPKQALLTFSVLSATGKATTDGFDNINGAIFVGEGRVRTDFFGLNGHQLIGGMYSNKQYTSLDQRVGDVIEGRTLAKRSGTWAVYYNFDQFLYETEKDSGKGVGVFGRFAATEGEPLPMQYFFSLGLGGKGMLPSRDFDRFGIGYFYTSINNPTFERRFSTRSLLRDEWGFEAFYNVALTPWLLLTPDIQVTGPAQKKKLTGEYIDTATILGVRLQIVL